ncbi:MAG: EAL domain-containing protein, partial [Rhizobium pusense]|nr:EAL domain-containing protein [Agrobacterium pusense]
MQAVTLENDAVRRFASGHMFPMAKLVLETAFQPIVEATTGTIFGYESLMRGHDRLGFSDPLALLDQAAQGGELKAFEQMLASRALAKFSTLPDFSSATLFLNLDVRLIAQGDAILDKLVGHLARAGIPPSSICFELSERFDNTSVPEFTTLIARMRKEGFKLA